jgi:hypothetical protein
MRFHARKLGLKAAPCPHNVLPAALWRLVSDVSAVESAAIRSSCSPKLRDAYGSVNAFWSFPTRNIQKVGMAATDSPQRNKAAEGQNRPSGRQFRQASEVLLPLREKVAAEG